MKQVPTNSPRCNPAAIKSVQNSLDSVIYTYDNVALGLTQQVRLNFSLQVGGQTEAIEVTDAADRLIATTSASVGSVLTDQKVKDLPPGRAERA